MRRAAIVAARRTPIGKFLGGFTWTTAVELGTAITRAVLEETKIPPERVGFVIFGNGRQAGNRPNPARQIAAFAGMPWETIAYTVNKTCGSGILSIAHGLQHIGSGEADVVIAGGTENMTRTPFIMDRLRMGYRMGDAPVLDGQYHDGLLCPISEMRMGETAEKLAEMYKIDREEQDRYAMMSQNRCEAAEDAGIWKQEIVAVEAKDARGRPLVVERDEHPRRGVTMEKLAKLPTVFKKDGTVTPGNACGLCDGAAATVLVAEDRLGEFDLEPLAWVEGHAFAGVDASIMGIAPVYATRNLLEKTGLGLDDFDVIELNEAFAAQVLACDRELHLDMEKTNVNGGAIALGHPIGCTGCRIVVTLLHEMVRRDAKRGLATLCQSGGLGTAMSLVRE